MAGQKRKGSGQDSDAQFMRIALRLAERMLGRTAPNPAVGAIIVDPESGELIARGWTQQGGRPHAETHVIERAGSRAAGKTMYVTLEPCSHHGQTPPCARAIVSAGLARVVCAIEDPDLRVSGRGLAMMRGGREYLAGKLGRSVKVSMVKTAKLNSPVYASALGLIMAERLARIGAHVGRP